MVKNRIVILFTMVFILLLPVFALAGTVDLPETGQTTSYAPGDDGDIRAGIPWPDPRFRDNWDGTVTDNLTGLMWTKDAYSPGPDICRPFGLRVFGWTRALDYVNCLNTNRYLGYSIWRLPNINELESLLNAGQADSAAWLNTQGFSNVNYFYWSSTTFAYDTNNAWYVSMSNWPLPWGIISPHCNKTMGCLKSVWPVLSPTFAIRLAFREYFTYWRA